MLFWSRKNSRVGMDEHGRTPLWHLAAHGDIAGVLTAIAAGAKVNLADDAGYTPLHAAVHNGHIEIIKQLIAVSADVNIVDKHGNNPLWTAMLVSPKDHKHEIIRLLAATGADPDHKNIYRKSAREVAASLGPHILELLETH